MEEAKSYEKFPLLQPVYHVLPGHGCTLLLDAECFLLYIYTVFI